MLASAGTAIAANGGDGKDAARDGAQKAGPPLGGFGRGPGGPGGHGPGAELRFLTFSETHTFKRGKETIRRIDAGKIKSVSSTSITVTERDGKDVTIALDGDSEIFLPANDDATTDDLKVGQSVVVQGEKGEAADRVGAPPTKRLRR